MLRRVLVAVVVAVLLGAFTLCLQINVGRSSDIASTHKRAAQELSLPSSDARAETDSTTITTVTTETTKEVTTTTSTTSTTTICPESSLAVSLNPSSYSIDVSWLFTDTCGTLEGFNVSWGNLEGDLGENVLSNVTKYTIEGLDPCEEYWVKVVAVGTHGPVEGNGTATTTSGVPSPVSALTVNDINARSLTLSWTAQETACTLSYTVAYSGTADWGDNPVKNGSTTVNATNVLLEGLRPFSNYSICVTATTDAGDSDETCTTAKTDEDAPTKPTNLSVVPASSRSLNASWSPPEQINGELGNYIVSWTADEEQNETTTAGTTMTIDGLDACVSYSVTVTASTGAEEGPPSDPDTAKTKEEVPPPVGAPTASNTTARSLTLSWTAPATACTLSYIVAYSGTADWGDKPVRDGSTTVDAANVLLEDLQPFSDYIISVTATTDAGNSDETCTTAKTDEDAPTKPTNLSVVPASSRSLNASWSPPEQINGELGNYTVSWTADKEQNETTTAGTTMTIDGLDACVSYSVTVTASTRAREGPASDPVSAKTEEEAPPVARDFTSPSSEARSVTLTWTRPDTACDVTEYIIKYNWTVKWDEHVTDHKEETLSSDGNATAGYTLTELVPYSTYRMCIVAVVGNLNGTEACLEQPVETLEDVPSEPTDLNVDNSTDTSILVSWKEPMEHNGILLQYSVTWSDGGMDNGSEATTNNTFYTIEDLISCVNYTVTVTASTSIGDGAGRNTSTTTADEIPPAVDDLIASDVTAETLTLSWSEPNTTCHVIDYTITFNGSAQWGINKTHIDSETVVTETISLNGLTPFSKYNVCVAADTSAGQGDTNCIETKTVEEEPSEPRNLQFTQTNNSIVVNWDKPVEENGVLLNYTISWLDDQGVDGSTFVVDPEHTIANLPACVTLTVKVAASTSVGFGPESENNTSTLVEVPPSVKSIEVLDVSARNLNLSWSSPDTVCDVTYYTITYSGTAQWGTNESYSNSTTEETETLSLDGLTPFSKYTVCVAASTSAGQGINNCTETVTEEDAPSEPTSLTVSELKAKKASITWDPPSDLNGYLTNYIVSVLGSDNNNTVDGPVTIPAGGQRSYSFTDLEPETIYRFQVKACTKAGCSYGSTTETTLKSWTVLIVSLCVVTVFLVALGALTFVKRDALRSALKTEKPQEKQPRSSSSRSLKYQRRLINKVEDAAVKKHHIAQCIEGLKSNEGSALQAEFEQMDKMSPTGTMNIATSPANYQKNRYINILPFDDNIVYLKSRTDNYVNASLVQDYEGQDMFIAAQGPMETTVTQFWQLVWEQKVENIVMLANCFESGKEKCAEYWPSLRQTKVLSHHFKIVNCSEEVNESFVVRTLEIRNKQSSRFVKQFHYTVWPDFGVPDDGASILDLMSAVKKNFVSSATEADRHILVHCSAGVGRTGTFIGVWNLCHRDLNEHSDEINVMKEVLDMRDKRVMMVQTADQYLMLYKCFQEYNNHVTRWPLPDTVSTGESIYNNRTENEHGSTSQQEPIYENTLSHQQEAIYENTNPRQQESIYENMSQRQQESIYESRASRQQESVYDNWGPRQQGPHNTNRRTPQTERYRNESPRRQASTFPNSSPQQEDGIYENDGPPQPPRPQRGYDLTGSQRNVYHN